MVGNENAINFRFVPKAKKSRLVKVLSLTFNFWVNFLFLNSKSTVRKLSELLKYVSYRLLIKNLLIFKIYLINKQFP